MSLFKLRNKERHMAARQKLNSGYVGGCILVAALIGWLTESSLIFLLALIVLVSLNVYSGDIRSSRRKP